MTTNYNVAKKTTQKYVTLSLRSTTETSVAQDLRVSIGTRGMRKDNASNFAKATATSRTAVAAALDHSFIASQRYAVGKKEKKWIGVLMNEVTRVDIVDVKKALRGRNQCSTHHNITLPSLNKHLEKPPPNTSTISLNGLSNHELTKFCTKYSFPITTITPSSSITQSLSKRLR